MNNQPPTTSKQSLLGDKSSKEGEIIREVWQDNLEKEFLLIQDLAEECQFVALDTEFPGVLYQTAQTEYLKIKQNADNLNTIQIGLTFAKSDGTYPSACTFQFNFAFNKDKDSCNKEAIKFLEESGIQFKDHARRGIQPADFAELMYSSGLLFNEDICWVTFHGGFDYCYFLKTLIDQKLPNTCKEFYEQQHHYFPLSVDVKLIIQEIDGFKYLGLEKLSKSLDLERIGPQHQAGSDSLMTMKVYFKLKEREKINFESIKNQIFGLSEYEDERQLNSQSQNYYEQQQYQSIFNQDYMAGQFFYQNLQGPVMNELYANDYSQMGVQGQMFVRNYSNNTFPNNEQRGGQPRRTPSQR
ncbi:hypothetical protein ABPG74_005620 [Tetrahymena malaccensis]